MVLMAATPSQPASNAAREGMVMSVTLGDIFAHTGLVAMELIQPHTSAKISGSWPIAIPICAWDTPERKQRSVWTRTTKVKYAGSHRG